MAVVYILESLKDGRYYIGSSICLERRLKHHLSGGTPSTKRFGGVKLVFSQKYSSICDARSVERKLKKLKRRDYIEKVIKEGCIKMRP